MRGGDIKLIDHRNNKRDKEEHDEDQSCNQQIDIYKRPIDRQLVTLDKGDRITAVKVDIGKLPINLSTNNSISQSKFNCLKNNILSDVKEIDDVTAKIRKGGGKTETSEYPRINQDSWIVYTNHKVEQNQSKNDFSTIG